MNSEEKATQRDAFAEKLLASLGGAFNIFTVYIGVRLGLYDAFVKHGTMTSAELASRAGVQERYVREWLEQQTVAGILAVEDPGAPGNTRRYALPPGHAEVLTERDSLDYMAPITRLAVGAFKPVSAVLEAFRNGGGVPYADYGIDLVEGQSDINRAAFLHLIGREWIPTMIDVHERLQADPPARVADFGCGAAWSSIGIARAYPGVHVDGFDVDEASITLARKNVAEAGVTDRVQLHVRDAGDPALAGQYDFVTAFECIHDMSQPVAALRVMRSLLGEGGVCLVADERVGDLFTEKGNDVEWMMYGWSVLHCLPVGMADEPSAGTGTVMRRPTFERYAQEAGFKKVTVLPIENLFFQFYRLEP